MTDERICVKEWKHEDAERTRLVFSDGEVVFVKKTDFDRAFGTIVSAEKHEVIRDFAIKSE